MGSFNRIAITLSLLLSLSLSYGQEHGKEKSEHHGGSESEGESSHCLLEENGFTIGLGAVYLIDKETIGLHSRFYYNIGEHICFGPEVSLFKKGELSIYDIDLVAHYIFETKIVGIYPLLGANYTYETYENSNQTKDALGVVFGVGVHRSFNKFIAFGEVSRVQSALADNFATVGLMYSF